MAKILKGSKLSLLLSLNFLDKQKELNLFPTKTSRISVEQKKRSLPVQKQLVSTQRNRVNERKKTNSWKTINRSKNFLYGFQENETKWAAQPSLSSKKRKKKKGKKQSKSNLAPLLVLKKKQRSWRKWAAFFLMFMWCSAVHAD